MPTTRTRIVDSKSAAPAPTADTTSVDLGRPVPTGSGAVSGAAMILGAKIGAQVVGVVSMAIVARILLPADYGLVAMVLCATAFLSIFNDLGLSLVTVQRPTISDAQLSALFWINVWFGIALAVITAASSPLIAWFFHDDRLVLVSIVMGLMYPLGALGVQHQALLKRNMRFRQLAMLRVAGSVFGAITAVALAIAGFGFWALVGQALATPAGQSLGAWILCRWKPGSTKGCEDLRSLIGFGSRLTGHGMLGYFTNSFDNLLLGRFAGQQMLGLYSISYRLMMRPINLAGYGVGESAIAAMSRVVGGGRNPRPMFRRMLSLTALLGVPACLAGAIWTPDVVRTLLGARWLESIPIVRLLLLAGIARILSASTGWVYVSTGRPDRMLRWQMMWAPFLAIAFVIGLPYGAKGMATAYLVANWIALIPAFVFCFRRTEFTLSDVVHAAGPASACALLSVIVPALVTVLMSEGPARLGIRSLLAVLLYGLTTPFFVPLVREGVGKFARRFGRARAQEVAPTASSEADHGDGRVFAASETAVDAPVGNAR